MHQDKSKQTLYNSAPLRESLCNSFYFLSVFLSVRESSYPI